MLTFFATVTGPGITPTGTVTWIATGPGGSLTCASSTALIGGVAICTVEATTDGVYSAAATYDGDSNYNGSYGKDGPVLVGPIGGPPIVVHHVVVVHPEVMAVAFSPWTIFADSTVHFRIHLYGNHGPVTGSVEIRYSGKTLCSTTLTNGVAHCKVNSSEIGRGRHHLVVDYLGAGVYQPYQKLVNIFVH
ncbi:MAG: Ig-like domain-containing protein [Acidimicrobiales bacterium]